MEQTKEFIIEYLCRTYNIVATNFYSACKKVILKERGEGVKFYVCRFYSYKDRRNKSIENYVITISVNSVAIWLKTRYDWLKGVKEQNSWFIAGTPLTFDNIMQNIQGTVEEPSIVDIVEQGKICYKYKYGFDVISLKS